MTNMCKKRRSGFTLIELLIVVAIIAILAAIAVPNFLEAQTRAKVSRALNDLRSMRTAIESYHVDHNRPPRHSWGCVYDDHYGSPRHEVYGTLVGGPSVDINGAASPLGGGGGVTSPIAYIASLPEDPFVAVGYDETLPVQIYNLYRYYSVKTFTDLLNAPSCPAPGGSVWSVPNRGETQFFEYALGAYVLKSIGPSGVDGVVADFQATHEQNAFTQYDPTNGTQSIGAIVVSHKNSSPVWISSRDVIWW